ncbi:MAG TPA: mucoidy inhibitor MuiA family protein, partial [Polyangia bacterium]
MRAAIKTAFGLGLVAALAPATARATASGDVDSVVVFADRARVTRARTAPCEKGTARAVFERLPAALDTRTLRGEAREAAEVIGLSSEQVNEREAADPRARALAADLDAAEAEIKRKQARQAALAAELEDVGAFGNVFSATLTEEIRNPKPNTPAWARTLDALGARRATLAAERHKLDVALRGLAQTAGKLRRQLAQVGGAGERAYRTAAVTIACRALPQVTATLSYVVGGAGWQPEYDVDVTPRGRGKTGPATARLTVGALIHQATGEDWTNVRVMLSTARPKLGSEAPQPAPLVVDGYEQKRDKVLVQAQERREQLGAGGGGEGKPAGPQAAALDDKGNAFVLTLPHPVTVIADGRPVWAPVDVVETQA